jgi:hypothetical protein
VLRSVLSSHYNIRKVVSVIVTIGYDLKLKALIVVCVVTCHAIFKKVNNVVASIAISSSECVVAVYSKNHENVRAI